ncbi:hypothetical protein EV363DRAFT_1405026 [Boletus edulis]|nr:hypothetical protein EV363DRAFT_1405026 [Boletus edulis]
MARTKQTAKLSSGGVAPRVRLIVRDPRDVESTPNRAITPTGLPPPHQQDHATLPDIALDLQVQPAGLFCHMCSDGGELWGCNVCVRSVCKKCLKVPRKDYPVIQHEDVKFLCVSCHLMDGNATKSVAPYMGFYRDRKSVLSQPPRIVGRFEQSPKSVIRASVTAVLHLRLNEYIPAKGPINMLFDFLRPFFVHSGGLVTADVPFDLGTEWKKKTYLERATKIVKKILAVRPSQVVFVISTHTDEDRGDLFAGVEGGKPICAEVQEVFFEILLGPFADLTPDSALYVLSCGRYIRHSASRKDFTKTVGSFGFSATIAFDAPRFHSTVAWSFLVILTESVVIRGHSFDDAVPIALANSNELKRHSGVYTLLLSTDRKLVNTTKYLWAHRDYRPWGKDVPIQKSGIGFDLLTPGFIDSNAKTLIASVTGCIKSNPSNKYNRVCRKTYKVKVAPRASSRPGSASAFPRNSPNHGSRDTLRFPSGVLRAKMLQACPSPRSTRSNLEVLENCCEKRECYWRPAEVDERYSRCAKRPLCGRGLRA